MGQSYERQARDMFCVECGLRAHTMFSALCHACTEAERLECSPRADRDEAEVRAALERLGACSTSTNSH
jgi:hypothetical protein